jgi:hypothetical protein
MAKILITIGLIAEILLSANAISGQSEKRIIKDNHVISTHRIDNGNVGFLVDNQDKTNTIVSAQGAKKFDYHPVVWDIQDSTLYVLEIRASNNFSDAPYMLGYRLKSGNLKEGNFVERTTQAKGNQFGEKIEEQFFIAAIHHFDVRIPLYYDICFDTNKENVYCAVLSTSSKKLEVFSKAIAEFQSENIKGLEGFERKASWKELASIDVTFSAPLNIFVKKDDVFIYVQDGNFYKIAKNSLQKQHKKKLQDSVLIIDKDTNELRYIPSDVFSNDKKMSAKKLRRKSKKLI